MSLDPNRILELGLPLIAKYEGLRLKPYLCPASIATIGYGSTLMENGRRVTLKDPPITKERALQLLRNTVLKTYLPAVLQYCPTLENEYQAAAILSFVYNLGGGALRSSTLRKRILAQDWASVPKELLKWNKGGGRELPGLTARRKAEAQLFMTKPELSVNPATPA